MRSLPSSVTAVTSLGITVYPQRTPVNPAVFEQLRNSMAHFLAPLISQIEWGMSSSCMYASQAASYRISVSLSRAYLTHFFNSSFGNTVPVGLFGQQRYIISTRWSGICGIKWFSAVHGIQFTLLHLPFSSTPARPHITLESIYTGQIGSVTPMELSHLTISPILPVSLLAPSLTKISLGSRCMPRGAQSFLTIASRKKSYPRSGPYPLNVALRAISSTALCIASITAGQSGCVTSPMPRLITRTWGCETLKALTFLAMSANK